MLEWKSNTDTMRIFPTRPSETIRLVSLVFWGSVSVFVVSAAMPSLFRLPDPRPGCEAPIRYRIGTVDPRFSIGDTDFRRTVFEAESVWERAIGKDILLYDPTGDLLVTTLFDERQMMTYDSRALEERIAEYEKTAGTLSERYDVRRVAYERDKAALEERIADFEADLRAYNRDVSRVNTQGGATEEEFGALEDRKESLADEQEEISDETDRLNGIVADLNVLAARLDTETTDVNAEVAGFRETYGEPQPFVQGLYDPNAPSITVYQFEREEDLRLVLAHEFGHALGIDEHVENDPSAIMYYLMDGQDVLHPTPKSDDIAAYADQACPIRTETLRERIVGYLVEAPRSELSLEGILRVVAGRSVPLLPPVRGE